MNILIKLMSIVSLVVAPTLAQLHQSDAANVLKEEKMIKVDVVKGDTTTTIIEVKNGDTTKIVID